MAGRILLMAVSLTLLAFAPAPWPRKERQREDPNDLTGTWAFTAIVHNGMPQPTNITNFTIQITKDRILFDTESKSEWTLKLYPAASPPEFTWGKGDQVNYVGSYRIQNGELSMIFTFGAVRGTRPTDFEKPPYKYVFRRIKRG